MPAKPRILFVDDEPGILTGLQHLLYKDRKRWDLVFALGGEEALATHAAGHFDVVISDMRMPRMDGATLLAKIRESSPSTIRIMLSGHADREAIVRALPALHQLLSKPCDAETLRAVLERSVVLSALPNETLRSLIGRLEKLPSSPELLDRVTTLLASNGGVEDIAQVIERDPGMCAKLLQLVNSAYFSTGRVTCSVRDAVARLGMDLMRYILEHAAVFGPFDRDPFDGFSLVEQQQHAYACAQHVAALVGQHHEAVLAALLHDVGCTILAIGLPDRYREIVGRKLDGQALCDAEREAFGVSHAEVGAALLRTWGLPQAIVDIVAAHHDPGSAAPALRELATAVQAADSVR